MNCGIEKLELFHDGELAPADRDDVRRHLEACELCRAALEGLEKVDGLVTRVPAGPQPHWDSYVSRVASRTRGGWTRWVAAAAAALLIGFTGWNLWEAARPKAPAVVARDVRAEVREALSRFAAAPNESARTAELSRIRECGDAALPIVVGALDDPSVRLQIAAAHALAELKDERIRSLLLEHARKQGPLPRNGEPWTLEEM